MKRKILIAVALMISCMSFGQHGSTVKGGSYLTLKYGASKYSLPTWFELQYGYAFAEKMSLRSGIVYEYGEIGLTKMNIASIDVDVLYNVFSLRERVFVNVGLGGYTGVEMLASLTDNTVRRRTVIFGAKGFVGLDVPLSNKITLGAEFAQWYDHLSKLGRWHYTGSINLNYIIN